MTVTPIHAAGIREAHFTVDQIAGDLKRLSVRGGAATLAGQAVNFVLNLGSTMILARLLTPKDFGLIAMVTAITGFIMVFRELGLSHATIQRAEINHGQVSTLFWINFAVGALLMLITLALAPAIALFYKDPRLFPVAAALSPAFIFSGLTVQHEALLRRQMRLTIVAVRDLVAMTVGILTAILCAWAGMGYWALVWMQIATAATNAAGVWLASGWIPGRPVRRSGVRSMLKFGGWLTGFSFVNYFARNLDNLLIGRFCGAVSLGLYSRAYSLLLFPIGQITAPMTGVAVPALSRLQNEPERYRSYYLKSIRVIAFISFPLVIAFAVLSNEVVVLVLGKQWLAATPVFRVLAITAIFQPILSTVGWLYISSGQSKRMAVWGIIACSIIAISFIVGLPWGSIGVATSYTVCSTLLIHPQLAVATTSSPLTPLDIYKAAFRPFCLSMVFGIGVAFIRSIVSMPNPIWNAIASIAGGMIILAISVASWPTAQVELRDVFAAFAILRHQQEFVETK